MKKLILFLSLFALVSCKKEKFEIDNLNGEALAIGHGGMGVGYTYPMNSFEAINYAFAIGADGVEIDLDMTNDGILVAFHDKDLSESTNGTGPLYSRNWADIKEVRYRSVPYSSYKLRTVDEILSNIPDKANKRFFFDCKTFNPAADAAYIKRYNQAISDLIDKHGIGATSFVEFKPEPFIEDLVRSRPDIKCIIYAEYQEAVEIAMRYQLHGIIQPLDELTEARVKFMHDKGFRVTVFNLLTREDNKRALELNVEYLQSDKLKHLITLL